MYTNAPNNQEATAQEEHPSQYVLDQYEQGVDEGGFGGANIDQYDNDGLYGDQEDFGLDDNNINDTDNLPPDEYSDQTNTDEYLKQFDDGRENAEDGDNPEDATEPEDLDQGESEASKQAAANQFDETGHRGGKPTLCMDYIRQNWKIISRDPVINQQLEIISINASSTVTAACTGLDYIVWIGMCLQNPDIIYVNTRLKGLLKALIVDQGLLASAFKFFEQTIDDILKMAPEEAKKIIIDKVEEHKKSIKPKQKSWGERMAVAIGGALGRLMYKPKNPPATPAPAEPA